MVSFVSRFLLKKPHKYQTFYFRHDVWTKIERKFVSSLCDSQFQYLEQVFFFLLIVVVASSTSLSVWVRGKWLQVFFHLFLRLFSFFFFLREKKKKNKLIVTRLSLSFKIFFFFYFFASSFFCSFLKRKTSLFVTLVPLCFAQASICFLLQKKKEEKKKMGEIHQFMLPSKVNFCPASSPFLFFVLTLVRKEGKLIFLYLNVH